MRITINKVAKIEGHGSFQADLETGKIKDAYLKILLGARFVEGIIVKRKYTEAPIITSRICGICSVAHNLTSIKALEKAMSVKPPPLANKLRELLTLSETIQSHAAHIYLLSLGDFLGFKSDLDLIKKYPDLSDEVFAIRQYGNRLKEIIGGRSMHLLASVVGGFTKPPNSDTLSKLLTQSTDILVSTHKLAEFVSKLSVPSYRRLTTYVGQSGRSDYSYYHGSMKSNKKISPQASRFYSTIDEEQRSFDPVKQATFKGHPYMVGALPRININYRNLNQEAKKYLREFPKLPCHNIFYNVLAQAVELVHAVAESKKLLTQISKAKTTKVFSDFTPKAGEGIAATEAPRGTLYHHYKLNKFGVITKSNIITPTAQFLPNLEADSKKFLETNSRLSVKNKKAKIAMLIRAYDPCLTCATH